MIKHNFLAGVFLSTFATLALQILQTRILSVIAWYYLAFFAISVAMLGMTAGAVWVYLRCADQYAPADLGRLLKRYAVCLALGIPSSLLLQFSLFTAITASAMTLVTWSVLLVAMTIPFFFSGIVVSLALTRSPYPVGQVYGADLAGAAMGCVGVIGLLNLVDAPSAVILCGAIAGLAAWEFEYSVRVDGERPRPDGPLPRPLTVALALAIVGCANGLTPFGVRPLFVKDSVEWNLSDYFVGWNSYSRIVAKPPSVHPPLLSGPSRLLPNGLQVLEAQLTIDGAAETMMFYYDGTPKSVDFLMYDLVNLGYYLPGHEKVAVIGVGGGRDIISAHLFGANDITGVELNRIFVNLLTRDPLYSRISNFNSLPNLKLHIDDARSWFASTHERFDLVQMSMIDTWASTGAGAFSLSENGLYTLEGWSAFLNALSDQGIFTVSRWYSRDDVNETGRMVSLATAALLKQGAEKPLDHIFIATAGRIATLVLSKRPLSREQLEVLHTTVERLGFDVLITPDHPVASPVLDRIVNAHSVEEIDAATSDLYLDLSVPTDNRPFFFNQLKFSYIPTYLRRYSAGGYHGAGESKGGVIVGNLLATVTLFLILLISAAAVVLTIVWPLRSTARQVRFRLTMLGSGYFGLIGMGFMLAEIGLLQYFSIFLGHPIYSLGICLFSLILATGIGSLFSETYQLNSRTRWWLWSSLAAAYLLTLPHWLPSVFAGTIERPLPARIAVTLAVLLPLGVLLGFAFPSGMRLTRRIDGAPTPWFFGINGVTGVLASVLAVICSIALGINATVTLSGLCYLALVPISTGLLALDPKAMAAEA